MNVEFEQAIRGIEHAMSASPILRNRDLLEQLGVDARRCEEEHGPALAQSMYAAGLDMIRSRG